MKKKLLSVSIFLITLAFIPFNTTLVPEWKVQVIDENGNPYKGKGVRQFCDSYTLGVSPCQDSNDFMRLTDENGYAVFPERKINMSLLFRLIRSVFNFVMQLAHGSFGVDIYLDSTGPQDYKSLKYIPGEPLPEKFILSSESFKKTEELRNFRRQT
ncbi:MAG: hypothetical protein WBD22_07420 [Pyrinomonadaceae bacterium]